MANRYWVGGSGTWNTSSTTNWSATSGGSSGASAPVSGVDSVIFNSASGTGDYTVTLAAGACQALTITDPAGAGNTLTFDGTTVTTGSGGAITLSSSTGNILFSNTVINANGSLVVSTPSTVTISCSSSLTFPNSGQNISINTNNCSVTCPVVINNSGGSTTLASNFTTTGSFTISIGTQLTITSRTLTCASFVHNGGLVTGTTGVVNITGTSGTVFNNATSSSTITATNTFNLTGSPTTGTTRTVTMVGGSTAVINLNVTDGSDAILITTSCNIVNLNFTGFSGTLSTAAVLNITGSLTLSSTMTVPDAATAITFEGATTTTQTITSNTVECNRPITFDTTGTGGVTIADTFTTIRAVSHNQGKIDITNKIFTCLTFNTSISISARSIIFGTTGQIKVTGSGLAYTQSNVSGLTLTGTAKVVFANPGSVATSIDTGSGTAAQRIGLSFTGGAYSFSVTTGNFNDVDFTNFSGTLTTTASLNLYGNLTLSPAMTITSSASAVVGFNFGATSGTKTINTNGITIARLVAFDGAGGTWQFLTDVTISQAVTHTAGTVDLNGKTLTLTTYSTATGTKNLTFNNGTIVVTSSGVTAFNNATPLNFSTTAGTAKGLIYMTSSSAKTFVGGGSTYAATLVQSGPLAGGAAGALTISGANTFSNIKANKLPCTIFFPASTTTTFADGFQLKGIYGSNVTINSSTTGTAATVARGSTFSVSCDFLTLKDNTANIALGGTWYAGGHSTIQTLVTGWTNNPPPTANTEFLTFLQNF